MRQGKMKTGLQQLCLGILLLGCLSSVFAQSRYGPVRAGETIYSILADRVPRTELNLRQWALATFALNPAAFGAKPGQLRVGSTLVIPSVEQAAEQWRRGLAIEQGKPTAQAPAVVLGRDEIKVPVPSPVWQGPSSTPPTPAAVAPIASTVTATKVPASVQKPPQPALTDEQRFRNHPAYDEIMAQVGRAPSTKLLDQMGELERRYAGDSDFDYAYGVVLLDSGQAQNALFSLLRASQERPKSLGIRLDLGRAYFEANDNESARVIFEDLKKQSPPPAAAEVIESYLQAILRRSSRYTATWVSVLSLEAGHDSNANSATDLTEFIGFSLDEQSRSAESAFAQVGLASQFAKPLTPRWRWLLSGQGRYRENFDVSNVNSLQLGLSSGLAYRRGAWQLSTRLSADALRIDGEENANSYGLNAGWIWHMTPFTRLQTHARLGALRYVDSLSVRDVDQWLLAIGVNRRGQWALGSEVVLKLIGGQDQAVEDNSPYGRNVLGSGMDITVQLTPRVRMVSNLQWLTSDYDGLFFGSVRKDEQWSSVLALELSDNRWASWMLIPSVRYVDNRSDVGLYEFDRIQYSLALSHSFE